MSFLRGRGAFFIHLMLADINNVYGIAIRPVREGVHRRLLYQTTPFLINRCAGVADGQLDMGSIRGWEPPTSTTPMSFKTYNKSIRLPFVPLLLL